MEAQNRSFLILDGVPDIGPCGVPEIEGLFSKGPVSYCLWRIIDNKSGNHNIRGIFLDA